MPIINDYPQSQGGIDHLISGANFLPHPTPTFVDTLSASNRIAAAVTPAMAAFSKIDQFAAPMTPFSCIDRFNNPAIPSATVFGTTKIGIPSSFISGASMGIKTIVEHGMPDIMGGVNMASKIASGAMVVNAPVNGLVLDFDSKYGTINYLTGITKPAESFVSGAAVSINSFSIQPNLTEYPFRNNSTAILIENSMKSVSGPNLFTTGIVNNLPGNMASINAITETAYRNIGSCTSLNDLYKPFNTFTGIAAVSEQVSGKYGVGRSTMSFMNDTVKALSIGNAPISYALNHHRAFDVLNVPNELIRGVMKATVDLDYWTRLSNPGFIREKPSVQRGRSPEEVVATVKKKLKLSDRSSLTMMSTDFSLEDEDGGVRNYYSIYVITVDGDFNIIGNYNSQTNNFHHHE